MNKMGLKYVAILLVTFCLYASESSGLGQGSIDINLLLDNPAIKQNILNAILKAQGSSVSQIQNVIDAAGGNVNQAVTGINSELKENLLSLQGGLVKANPQAVINVVKNAIQSSIHDNLSGNPTLASAVQDSVDQQIDASSAQLDAAVEASAIPIDVAQQSLNVRRKRSLEPKDGLDLGQVVADLVKSIIGDQITGLISGLLDSVKNLLSSLIVVVAPDNPIGTLIAGVVNFVVKGLLDVVTVIQQSLTVPQTSTDDTAAARRKRDASTDVADGGDAASNDGLLDGIVRPVLTLLANILTPVNGIVKGLVNTISGLLQPVLGSLIITRLSNIINPIIDLLIPANPI